MTRPAPLEAWHRIVADRDAAGLDALIADDCCFRSPAVFAPQEGKATTITYLTAAIRVLGPTLRYVDEWSEERSAVLEFEAEVDGRTVHGVDMLRWGEDGLLTSFTVMIRPFHGLQAMIAAMMVELGLG